MDLTLQQITGLELLVDRKIVSFVSCLKSREGATEWCILTISLNSRLERNL